MILPIYLYGQPVLRKQAAEVQMEKEELKQLVADMFETSTYQRTFGVNTLILLLKENQ